MCWNSAWCKCYTIIFFWCNCLASIKSKCISRNNRFCVYNLYNVSFYNSICIFTSYCRCNCRFTKSNSSYYTSIRVNSCYRYIAWRILYTWTTFSCTSNNSLSTNCRIFHIDNNFFFFKISCNRISWRHIRLNTYTMNISLSAKCKCYCSSICSAINKVHCFWTARFWSITCCCRGRCCVICCWKRAAILAFSKFDYRSSRNFYRHCVSASHSPAMLIMIASASAWFWNSCKNAVISSRTSCIGKVNRVAFSRTSTITYVNNVSLALFHYTFYWRVLCCRCNRSFANSNCCYSTCISIYSCNLFIARLIGNFWICTIRRSCRSRCCYSFFFVQIQCLFRFCEFFNCKSCSYRFMMNWRIRFYCNRSNIPVGSRNFDCKICCIFIRSCSCESSVIIFCRSIKQSLHVSSANFFSCIIFCIIFPFIMVSIKLSFIIRSKFCFSVLAILRRNTFCICHVCCIPFALIIFWSTLNSHVNYTAFRYWNIESSKARLNSVSRSRNLAFCFVINCMNVNIVPNSNFSALEIQDAKYIFILNQSTFNSIVIACCVYSKFFSASSCYIRSYTRRSRNCRISRFQWNNLNFFVCCCNCRNKSFFAFINKLNYRIIRNSPYNICIIRLNIKWSRYCCNLVDWQFCFNFINSNLTSFFISRNNVYICIIASSSVRICYSNFYSFVFKSNCFYKSVSIDCSNFRVFRLKSRTSFVCCKLNCISAYNIFCICRLNVKIILWSISFCTKFFFIRRNIPCSLACSVLVNRCFSYDFAVKYRITTIVFAFCNTLTHIISFFNFSSSRNYISIFIFIVVRHECTDVISCSILNCNITCRIPKFRIDSSIYSCIYNKSLRISATRRTSIISITAVFNINCTVQKNKAFAENVFWRNSSWSKNLCAIFNTVCATNNVTVFKKSNRCITPNKVNIATNLTIIEPCTTAITSSRVWCTNKESILITHKFRVINN